MLSEPRLEQRDAQPYAAIRSRVSMDQLATDLPDQVPQVFDWLAAQGTAPAGAPFFRYLAMHEDGSLDVDVGVPVAAPITGNARFIAAIMPAGSTRSRCIPGHTMGSRPRHTSSTIGSPRMGTRGGFRQAIRRWVPTSSGTSPTRRPRPRSNLPCI